MSIKSFIGNFQDELYIRRSFLHLLGDSNLSPNTIEAAIRHTEDLLDNVKFNVEFLDTESKDIEKEVAEIFDSIDSKIDKINRFSDALIAINSTEDTSDNILTIHPYVFDNNIDNWERIQKSYIISPESSYQTFKPFSNNHSSNKGLAKFVVDSSLAVKYIYLTKDVSTNITNITYLDNTRNKISSEQVSNNLSDSNIILTIPINTRLINVEYEYQLNTDITLVPLSFKHKESSIIKLEDVEYKYGDNISFLVKEDIPFGCFAQLKLTALFKDVNGNILHEETNWMPINNDGKVVVKRKDVTTEKMLRVWKEGLFTDLENEQLEDDDYILCEPIYSDKFILNTEHSFKTKVKHCKSIKIIPVLYMYSLASKTLTPRIFSITGITRNEETTN